MPKDPRHTVREGRHIAWRSAWDMFGRRHWRWFVYGRLIVPTITIGLIAVPVVVAYRAVDFATLMATLMIVGMLAVIVGIMLRLSMADVRASMMGRRSAVPSVLMSAGAVLIVFGALALTL
jgi:hypothetical protein